jgi:hypothetical protein
MTTDYIAAYNTVLGASGGGGGGGGGSGSCFLLLFAKMYTARKTTTMITKMRIPQTAQLIGVPDAEVGVGVGKLVGSVDEGNGVGVPDVKDGLGVIFGVGDALRLQLRVSLGETSITKEGVSLEYIKTLFWESGGSFNTTVTASRLLFEALLTASTTFQLYHSALVVTGSVSIGSVA